MKTLTLLIMASLAVGTVQAQSQHVWNKDDRNNLYNDCMGYSGKFKNITPEQKESICLCYLEEITKKNNRQEYMAKIEIEVKRIREASLSQCSKNIGVALDIQDPVADQKPPAEISKSKPGRDALLGTWRTDKGETIEFKEDGKFSQTNLKGVVSVGEWFLDEEGTLTIVIEKRRTQMITKKEIIDRASQKYDVNSFSKSFLKFTNRVLGETTQANRIK